MYRESDVVALCLVKGCENPQQKSIVLIDQHIAPGDKGSVKDENVLGLCGKHATFMWNGINANIDRSEEIIFKGELRKDEIIS